MTAFNTDHQNAELLDQELSFDELKEINGGVVLPLVLGFDAAVRFVAEIFS